jgi:hypothetical protein
MEANNLPDSNVDPAIVNAPDLIKFLRDVDIRLFNGG